MGLKKAISSIMSKKIKFVLMVGLLVVLNIWLATANPDPEGPTSWTQTNETTRSGATPQTENVIAGNISSVVVVAASQTQYWAGYVGNVSGNIVLDNVAGNTLYSWATSAVTGEVYASDGSGVDWSNGNVVCYNASWTGGEGASNNLTVYEAAIGFTGVDGWDETFQDATTHTAFDTGTIHFDAGKCAAVQLYNNTEVSNAGEWEEVTLYDLSGDHVIYTSILEDNTDGYDGKIWDFQMIVAEDGSGNTATTPYYFYFEMI